MQLLRRWFFKPKLQLLQGGFTFASSLWPLTQESLTQYASKDFNLAGSQLQLCSACQVVLPIRRREFVFPKRVFYRFWYNFSTNAPKA